VHFLQGLPEDVKVALILAVMVVALAGMVYLNIRFGRRRG
jgi:hypothetical protein